MTRGIAALVLGALILAYGVRLVWLRDLFGAPTVQELVGLAILVALLLKQLLGIPLVDAPVARTAHAVAQPPAVSWSAPAADAARRRGGGALSRPLRRPRHPW